MKVNKNVKRVVCSIPGGGSVCSVLRNAYVSWRRHAKCRRLRKYGCAILDKVFDALNETGAGWFIDWGTLLGFAREHSFIRHDDDIDISVFAGSCTPMWLFERISAIDGFVFSHAFEFRGQITELTFKYQGIDVDFFFVYPSRNSWFIPSYERVLHGKVYPDSVSWSAHGMLRNIDQELVTAKLLRSSVRIPRNYEDLLKETYGLWQIPVKKWNDRSAAVAHGRKPLVYFDDFSRVVGRDRVVEIGSVVHLNAFEDQ